MPVLGNGLIIRAVDKGYCPPLSQNASLIAAVPSYDVTDESITVLDAALTSSATNCTVTNTTATITPLAP